MVFTRPSNLPIPTIWHRFTVQRGGKPINLRVQDLTSELVEPAVKLLTDNFTRDEPPCKYIEINKHPTAVAALQALWRDVIKDNVSLVCVEDRDEAKSELVGVNVLKVACSHDEDEDFRTEDPVWGALFGAVTLVAKSVDIFKKYHVDKYLTAYGLVVAPEWRGMSIGKEILKARYQRRISDLDIRAICLYVRELPRRITRLDLAYNKITDDGFFKLLKKLLVKGRSSVINLNIMNNQLTEKSIWNLAKYAKYVKLKYLRLNGNHFGTKGGEYFANFLMNNDTVEYCDIGETNQTLTSTAQIIAALRSDHGGSNKTVKVFDYSRIIPVFDRYSLESKWLSYHIELLLERNSTIIELHLQKNEFISHDMEYLVRGLRRNKTLLYLDLGYNKIGDFGAELLGKYFKEERPQLLFLNIAGNGIKDTGARALSFGLPFSKIRALDICHNKINDRGILDILNSMKKINFIRFLNIWGNNINHVTCEVIERMLLSGVLFQHTIDIEVYEVDDKLYAAYYPNPADRNKHLYYCELDYGYAQPIYHIKRNKIEEKKQVKVDCKQRHKLDKTTKYTF